jgi:protein-S-isoprenylcysteine O-methyltransferase
LDFPLYLILDASLLIFELALVFTRRSSGGAGGSRSADRGSVRLLWIVTAIAITAGHEIAFHGVGPYLTPAAFWRWAGVALFIPGLLLRWWAIRHLGRFFTVDVAIAREHRVIEDGPFRFVRHPSYSGLLLEYAGISCTLRSVPGGLAMMLPIFLVLLYRVGIEESALSEALGEPYVDYMRRTKRFVPWVF